MSKLENYLKKIELEGFEIYLDQLKFSEDLSEVSYTGWFYSTAGTFFTGLNDTVTFLVEYNLVDIHNNLFNETGVRLPIIKKASTIEFLSNYCIGNNTEYIITTDPSSWNIPLKNLKTIETRAKKLNYLNSKFMNEIKNKIVSSELFFLETISINDTDFVDFIHEVIHSFKLEIENFQEKTNEKIKKINRHLLKLKREE